MERTKLNEDLKLMFPLKYYLLRYVTIVTTEVWFGILAPLRIYTV